MSANTRKLFGTIHLWMGLLVGIPAAILGVTGIVLMLVHPLPAQVGASIPPDIDRTLALARTAAPKGAVVQQFAPPVAAGQPATVRFAAPRTSENPRGFAAVEIDPATGAIVPPAPPIVSTTTLWPSVLVIDSATRRATVSVGPPAAAGTMRVIGLFG